MKFDISLGSNFFEADGVEDSQLTVVETMFRTWVNGQAMSGAVELEELTEKLKNQQDVLAQVVDQHKLKGADDGSGSDSAQSAGGTGSDGERVSGDVAQQPGVEDRGTEG